MDSIFTLEGLAVFITGFAFLLAIGGKQRNLRNRAFKVANVVDTRNNVDVVAPLIPELNQTPGFLALSHPSK